MSNSYTLVNPFIHGDFKSTVKSKNSVNAAKSFYKNLSEHFNNNIPKFYFTIQKGGSGKGKYYHFKVAEQRNKNNVSFTIEPYDVLGSETIDAFTSRLNNFKTKFAQSGGKKKGKDKGKGKSKGKGKGKKSKDSSESESESESELESSDDYKRINTLISTVNQPIYYWWYDPSIYKLDTYYIPTFYAYVTPVIEIVLNN